MDIVIGMKVEEGVKEIIEIMDIMGKGEVGRPRLLEILNKEKVCGLATIN